MVDMTKVDEAIRWAADLHSGQVRDGESALPYITHPIEVLIRLRWVGEVTEQDMLCAAVLHDTIEECGINPEEIEQRFGRRVRQLVEELTRQEPTEIEIANRDADEIYDLRSKMLLDGIAQMCPDAMAIKLSDRLSNLEEAVRVRAFKKLRRYVRQTDAILKTIPRSANEKLWRAVREANDRAKRIVKDGKD